MTARGWATSSRELAWALACFAIFLCLYGVTSRAEAQVSDEVAMLATGVSVGTDGTLAIDGLGWLDNKVDIGEIGTGGHLYAKYFPGNILGSALLYRLGAVAGDQPYVWGSSDFGYHIIAPSQAGARLALRLNALLGALGMTMLFVLVRRRYDLATALTTVLLMGLGSDWWYQSRGFFSEVGAGAFLIAGLFFADLKRPYACAMSLGLSLLFRPTNLIALPIWVYSFRAWRGRDVVSAAYLLVAISVLGYFNWLRFGSVANFGYGSASFTWAVLVGLMGVLLSPGRSVFFYSPPLILALSGIQRLLDKDRSFALLVGAVVSAYVLAGASWQNWWGGKAWGSRLLTPVVPLLGFLLAGVIAEAFATSSRRLWASLITVAVLGFGIQLLAMTSNPVSVLDGYLKSGYATYAQSIMSISKNWLALQLANLTQWNPCQLDAYSLRTLLFHCD